MLAINGAGSTRGFYRGKPKGGEIIQQTTFYLIFKKLFLIFFLEKSELFSSKAPTSPNYFNFAFFFFLFREIRTVFQQSPNLFSPKQTESRCVLKELWLGEHREVHMGFPVRVYTSRARVGFCQCRFCCSLQGEQAQLWAQGIP